MIKVNFKDQDFFFMETMQGPNLVSEIFFDNYRIFDSGLKFELGDIILDLGANEGLFSIMMAKIFPVKIVALEPVRRTFKTLLENLEINRINGEVEPRFVGVAEKRGKRDLYVHKDISGASSNYLTPNQQYYTESVEMVTLDDAIALCGGRIRLLKVDIEGGEYDAFYASKNLHLVDNVVGEFHINQKLRDKGYSIEGLVEWLSVRTNLIYFESRDLWE